MTESLLPKHILITGASSGIGAALAQGYAREGAVLYLQGRDKLRLDEVAQACQATGADVYPQIIDVRDQYEMDKWIKSCDDHTPLDLVVANAGISSGTGGNDKSERTEQVRAVFDVNVTGVLNTIDPVLPAMRVRGAGQIALMSSLASFSGWPGAPAYSSSKAAVRTYGEALRLSLAGTGVKVNVICPGFIKTPMTDVNPYKMPFLMDVSKAAQIIMKDLRADKGRIAFPWQTYAIAGVIGLLPYGISGLILGRAPEKPDA